MNHTLVRIVLDFSTLFMQTMKQFAYEMPWP